MARQQHSRRFVRHQQPRRAVFWLFAQVLLNQIKLNAKKLKIIAACKQRFVCRNARNGRETRPFNLSRHVAVGHECRSNVRDADEEVRPAKARCRRRTRRRRTGKRLLLLLLFFFI